MPSSYTARLKLERQVSGENSGTWGDLVNYTFNRLDASVDGWANVNVAGSANVTLTSNNATLNTNDSTTDDEVHNRTLELFGALTGNINVFTGDVENSFTVFNNTTGAYTLTFGPTTGTGVILAQGAKTIVYSDGSTMLDVMADLGDVSAITVSTSGNASITGNVSAGNISATGIIAATGDVSSSGNVVATTGKQTIWVPAVSMYAETTAGAELTQTELTAHNPEVKSMDYDPTTMEFAQFAVSFPKNWDEGVVTFQVFFSPSATNTGTCSCNLAGVSIANDVDMDASFGTAIASTPLAGTGTQDDLMVSAESANVTITSAAADCTTFFQLIRDVGTDTNTGDMRVLGIKLFYTTDASNDG